MLVIFHDSAVFSPSKTCFPRGYRRRRCRPVLLQSCPETIRNTTLCTSTCRGDDPGARWSCKVHPRSRLCHVRGLEPLVGPGLPPCSPLTPRATCTVKVLTKLKATDGGAATTIPQVCGGGWVAHSPTQRTVHLWTLPHAPLRLLCVASASRSSCSTSTPSRRSARRTGASRSRCWCAASHHCASVVPL